MIKKFITVASLALVSALPLTLTSCGGGGGGGGAVAASPEAQAMLLVPDKYSATRLQASDGATYFFDLICYKNNSYQQEREGQFLCGGELLNLDMTGTWTNNGLENGAYNLSFTSSTGEAQITITNLRLLTSDDNKGTHDHNGVIIAQGTIKVKLLNKTVGGRSEFTFDVSTGTFVLDYRD